MGFEPTVPFGTPDFESGTFGHSATLPKGVNCTTGPSLDGLGHYERALLSDKNDSNTLYFEIGSYIVSKRETLKSVIFLGFTEHLYSNFRSPPWKHKTPQN